MTNPKDAKDDDGKTKETAKQKAKDDKDKKDKEKLEQEEHATKKRRVSLTATANAAGVPPKQPESLQARFV